MLYCKFKKRGLDDTHTSGSHAEYKRYPSALCLLVDHDYCKLLGKISPNYGTSDGYYGRRGNQGSGMDDNHTSAISKLFQQHPGKLVYSNFTSFLSELSKLMDCLKLFGMAYLTGVSMPSNNYTSTSTVIILCFLCVIYDKYVCVHTTAMEVCGYLYF